MELVPPCELERALRVLRPLRLRLLLEQRHGICEENFATLQFRAWATCADLVLEATRSGERRYDYVFRTRPDVFWGEPVALTVLAANLDKTTRRDVVITHNDWHMLLHVSQLGALATLRNASCATRCNRCKRCLFREIFDDFNEYCVLINHLASWRLRHIEAAHPADPRIYHYPLDAPDSPWLNALRAGKLTRWEKAHRPAQQPSGTRIVCRGPPLRCEYCGPRWATPCAATLDLTLPPARWAHPRPSSPRTSDLLTLPRVHEHEAFVNASSRRVLTCGTKAPRSAPSTRATTVGRATAVKGRVHAHTLARNQASSRMKLPPLRAPRNT